MKNLFENYINSFLTWWSTVCLVTAVAAVVVSVTLVAAGDATSVGTSELTTAAGTLVANEWIT